jgi:AcrR family transcriptional regulator
VTTLRRTQAERRAEARRRLLDAAMQLIAERGVRAVTLAATGERAGFSRGIVTHHFGSRRGLLDALTLELQNRFSPPEPPLRGLARLLMLADAYLLDLAARPLDTRVFLVLWAEALAAEADLRPVFAARDARFRDTIAECLRQGVEDGEIRDSVEPAALAPALVGQLRGLSLQLIAADADAEPVRRQLRDLLERGLRA